MVRIERFVFGYRLIYISEEHTAALSSMLFRHKIQADFFPDGRIIIRERDFEKFKIICNNKITYNTSEELGIPGMYKRIKHKPVVFTTAFVMFFLVLLLSNVVWDIRISGNETLSDAEILCELSDNGFEIGKLWQLCDRSKIENNMLVCVEEIGWININRRGAVAYIEVIESERKNNLTQIDSEMYTNIVASADCVIEEITVVKGVAAVKPGDVVKKGDLLISGVLTADEGLCRAEGTVKGRMTDTVTATTERNYKQKTKMEEKLCSVTFNLFNFSINIFKIYGNLTGECDIIEDVDEYSIFGVAKLPFSIKKEYVKEFEINDKSYSDSELINITSVKLSSALHARLVSADLSKIRTYGEFTKTGYKMYSDIVFCANVGCEVKMNVD